MPVIDASCCITGLQQTATVRGEWKKKGRRERWQGEKRQGEMQEGGARAAAQEKKVAATSCMQEQACIMDNDTPLMGAHMRVHTCAFMEGACACIVRGSGHMRACMQEKKGLWCAKLRGSLCLGSFLWAGWQENDG